MQSQLVDIKLIKSNPNNPRVIKDDKFEKLVESINSFPEMLHLRPIVVNDEMVVLGGNMRLKACAAAGIKEIPIVKAHLLTPEQQREFIIKDNLGYGEWDWQLIAKDWDAKELEGWGLDIPDFRMPEELQEDEYDIPDDIQTDIVAGDLFEIGPHRLICGDSTKPETFNRLMAGKEADLVVTDPPYNVNYTGGTKKKLKIENDSMSVDDFSQFLMDFHMALVPFTKAGCPWYVWHADSSGALFRSAFELSGLKLAQCLIWKKNSLVMGRQDYQWQHEPCLYGWKEGAAHPWYSDRKQTTILEFDRPQRNAEHPTMKPVPLIGYQIANSSKSGDIVVDAFGGSGTTMVASEQIGRCAYLVEFDPKYCQVIVDRMLKLNPDLIVKKNGTVYEREVV